MSEEILKALMELFALVVKQDGGILNNEREFVVRFLTIQLSRESVEEYLALFDMHAGPVIQKIRLKSNPSLQLKILLRFWVYVKRSTVHLTRVRNWLFWYGFMSLSTLTGSSLAQRMNIINTVAEVFKITQEEFAATERFVLNDDPGNLNNPAILVLSPGDEECELCKRMQTGYQNSKIFVLRIESVDLYFIKYISDDQLYLNGLPITSGSCVYTC